jgi:hypothetical protein
MLYVVRFDLLLVEVFTLYSCGIAFRGLIIMSDNLTPEYGGAGVVAKGFGFATGASDGCGGGVARRRSSRRI